MKLVVSKNDFPTDPLDAINFKGPNRRFRVESLSLVKVRWNVPEVEVGSSFGVDSWSFPLEISMELFS